MFARVSFCVYNEPVRNALAFLTTWKKRKKIACKIFCASSNGDRNAAAFLSGEYRDIEPSGEMRHEAVEPVRNATQLSRQARCAMKQ